MESTPAEPQNIVDHLSSPFDASGQEKFRKKPQSKKKSFSPAKFLSLTQFLAKKEAEKYHLFLIDADNLMYSLRQMTMENNLRISPFARLKQFYSQYSPYRVLICASNHLAKYEQQSEKDPQVTWLYQTMKKGQQDADVDTLLTGEAIELILTNTNQIKSIFLGSGDKDLRIILEKAMKNHIPCQLIGINSQSMAKELIELVPKCHYLF